MKPLIYDLIKGKVSGNSSDTYATISTFSSYPRISSTEGQDKIQVLVNKSSYAESQLDAYDYYTDPNPCKFIIYYTNQNKIFTNKAPSSSKITFQENKTYIYEPIKYESDHLFEGDWIKAGKYIDFKTKEMVGWHYKYEGIMQ